jgi:hypothetical protein
MIGRGHSKGAASDLREASCRCERGQVSYWRHRWLVGDEKYHRPQGLSTALACLREIDDRDDSTVELLIGRWRNCQSLERAGNIIMGEC